MEDYLHPISPFRAPYFVIDPLCKGELPPDFDEACMSNNLIPVTNFLARLSNAALWLAGGGLILMTVFVAWQVFCRYVLNDSPSWTEPGSVMLMSWFIFLGAAVGIRENNHLGFDVLLYVLPKSGKRVLRMISDAVILAFGAGMIWYGGALMSLTWNTTLPSLGIFRRVRLSAASRRRRPCRDLLAGADCAAPRW